MAQIKSPTSMCGEKQRESPVGALAFRFGPACRATERRSGRPRAPESSASTSWQTLGALTAVRERHLGLAVVVTNSPDDIDPALLRPGRIDLSLTIDESL